MKRFYKPVYYDREEIIQFLRGHFRYWTMHSWNIATSYANCIKIHRLDLPKDVQESMWDTLDQGDFYTRMSEILEDFSAEYPDWVLYTNGRSGGYVVLARAKKNEQGRRAVMCGQSVDQDEDFSEWGDEDLADRCELICHMDKTCDLIVDEFISYCRLYRVEEKEVMVPKKVKVLVER